MSVRPQIENGGSVTSSADGLEIFFAQRLDVDEINPTVQRRKVTALLDRAAKSRLVRVGRIPNRISQRGWPRRDPRPKLIGHLADRPCFGRPVDDVLIGQRSINSRNRKPTIIQRHPNNPAACQSTAAAKRSHLIACPWASQRWAPLRAAIAIRDLSRKRASPT